jgi:hypothetical protein
MRRKETIAPIETCSGGVKVQKATKIKWVHATAFATTSGEDSLAVSWMRDTVGTVVTVKAM